MSSLDKIDHEKFAEAFLEAYLKDGFANMPKREIDLLVLRLLVEFAEGWSWEEPPSAFELAQELRAKRGRFRSMLDELSFRNAANEKQIKARLHRLLEKSEHDIDGNKVKVQIEDGYLREYAKNLIHADFGIVDTSFDRSIVTLSGDKFLLLITKVMGSEAEQTFNKELEKYRDRFSGGTDEKNLFNIFWQDFVRSAGEEAGKKAIRLGAAILTGGLSDIPKLFRLLLDSDKGAGEA